MGIISMTVVIDDSHIGCADQMRASLEALGLKVSRYLPEIGVITGQGNEALLDSVRAMDGIEEARPEHQVRLPPLSDRVPQ